MTEDGDLLVKNGDLQGALAEYRNALARAIEMSSRLREIIAGSCIAGDLSEKADHLNEPTIAILHFKIAEVQSSLGHWSAALDSYRTAVSVGERFAVTSEPEVNFLFFLSHPYRKVGEILQKQGDISGAAASYEAVLGLFERLAAHDPDNVQWYQCRIETASMIGDVLMQAGDAAGALDKYQYALALAERAAQSVPALEWEGFKAIGYAKAGRALELLNRNDEARDAYRTGRMVAAVLAGKEPQAWRSYLEYIDGRTAFLGP